MSVPHNLLEVCSRPSKQYAKLMSKYKGFFNCIFSNPLQAFGYERWTTDNMYFGLSNMPAIAELFLETKAFEDQNVIVQPKHMSSFCTFIYPNTRVYNSNYNSFRKGLEEHLEIRLSFCVIKRQLHYCEAFVWNFKKPNISLAQEKRIVIDDFLKNSTLIHACIQQFNKDIRDLLPQKVFSGINISQHSPLYMENKNPAANMGDYSQNIELSHYIKLLKRENLNFNDFGLSQQEQEMIISFLEKDQSYPLENLKNIALKFDSLKCGENFEGEYNVLQRIGLTR